MGHTLKAASSASGLALVLEAHIVAQEHLLAEQSSANGGCVYSWLVPLTTPHSMPDSRAHARASAHTHTCPGIGTHQPSKHVSACIMECCSCLAVPQTPDHQLSPHMLAFNSSSEVAQSMFKQSPLQLLRLEPLHPVSISMHCCSSSRIVTSAVKSGCRGCNC